MRLTVLVGNEVGSNPAASIATEDISGTWRNSTMTVLCRLLIHNQDHSFEWSFYFGQGAIEMEKEH